MPYKFSSPLRKLPAIEAKYIANRTAAGNSVIVQTQAGREHLRLRSDLISYRPPGFGWAHTGSGPAQLALALLAHASGSDEFALEHHQVFQHEIVARLPRNGWQLTSEQVLQMVRFVWEGTEPQQEDKSAKTCKTAIIRALLPNATHDRAVTAHGSAQSTGGAIERALRNLLRDARLRRRTIVNLQIELSIVNSKNGNEWANLRVEDAQT